MAIRDVLSRIAMIKVCCANVDLLSLDNTKISRGTGLGSYGAG
jgi:hypothetical protein